MRPRIILLAILVALLQIMMHAVDIGWVIPNLVLVYVVWYAPKLEYIPMTLLVIVLSAVLELGSLLPTGLVTLSLFLVMLASKLVFRGNYDTNKWTFQLVLIAIATVLMNLISYATLPVELMVGRLGYVSGQILLEVLYNGIILLLVVGLSERRVQGQSDYRLPR